VLLAVLLGLAVGLAACARDDPFEGLWWEPSSGRRIEISAVGDVYRFSYGVAQRPYRAMREGDELRIKEPMGGEIVVRAAEDGELELVIGGSATRLKPLPQQQ